MEQGDGNQLHNYRGNITTPHTLCRISPSITKRQSSVPKIRNIWIPQLFTSPNHFVKFFIPSIEDLFQNGDHVLRVEHIGSRCRIISWRIWRDSEQRWQYQHESTDEKNFSILPSNIIPLKPVEEGD